MLLAIVIDVVYSFTASPLQTVCVVALGWMFVIMRHERLPLVFLPRFAEFRPAQVDRPSIDFLKVQSIVGCCSQLAFGVLSLSITVAAGPACVSSSTAGTDAILTSTFNYSRPCAPGATDDDNFSNSTSFLFFYFRRFRSFPCRSLSPAVNGSKATHPKLAKLGSYTQLVVCVPCV